MAFFINKMLLILTMLLIGNSLVFAQTAAMEDLKIAYLYNFTKYTIWPEETATNQDENFYFCIASLASFNQQILDKLGSKKINNRNLVFLDLLNSDVKKCNVIYSETFQNLPKIIKNYIEKPGILTISGINQDAVIQFLIVENKLRFKINLELMHKNHLSLSSQLLKLAIQD